MPEAVCCIEGGERQLVEAMMHRLLDELLAAEQASALTGPGLRVHRVWATSAGDDAPYADAILSVPGTDQEFPVQLKGCVDTGQARKIPLPAQLGPRLRKYTPGNMIILAAIVPETIPLLAWPFTAAKWYVLCRAEMPTIVDR
eukprot:14530325-Alexandrium_andersonii.AAC.1